MSADFDADDLARLLALEHAFGAICLISASNFAHLAGTTPSAAVETFRNAIEGSLFDSTGRPDVLALQRKHLKRLFDHLEGMAQHADLGVS